MGHSLDFFNQKDFEFLKKFSGIKKDLSEEQHVSTYNYLRDTTYPKVEYWIAKTQEKIFPDGDYDILITLWITNGVKFTRRKRAIDG